METHSHSERYKHKHTPQKESIPYVHPPCKCYGAENWTMKNKSATKLGVTQRASVGEMLEITLIEHKIN